MNIGDLNLGVTFDFPLPTSVGGVPTPLAGSPTFAAYGDDGSGPLLGIALGGSGGDYKVTVIATTPNGYAAGVNYTIKMLTGTLGGITITPRAVGYFSLNNRSVEGFKKGIAFSAFPFEMILSSDHSTPGTGLTVTATRKLDSGIFAACTNAPVEVSGGLYAINLSAADMNGIIITLRFTAPGADPTEVVLKTAP